MTQVHEAHSFEHEQSAALYTLGMLDGPERSAFEQHLAECSRCQRLVAEDDETVGLLLEGIPEADAPPAFRSRLMTLVDLPPPTNGHELVRPPSRLGPSKSLARSLRIKAFALVAALMATFGAGLLVGQRYTANQVLVSVPLQALSSPGSATVVVRAGGEADLELHGLPDPPAGHVYEAWTLDANGYAVMAGVYDDGDGTFQLDQSPLGRTVEITVEPAPRSDHPTTGPIFAANVSP